MTIKNATFDAALAPARYDGFRNTVAGPVATDQNHSIEANQQQPVQIDQHPSIGTA
jgi:hypothetical protein